jgi:hypothetical protein
MGAPRVNYSPAYLRWLYVDNQKSGYETARLLGVSRSTLSRLLVKHAIDERDKSQALSGRTLKPAHRDKVVKHLKQYKANGAPVI